MNKKTITSQVSRSDFIKAYLVLWNGIIGLTDKELDLTVGLVEKYIELKEVIKDERYLYEFLFSTQVQKDIRNKIGMKEQTFHNYKVSLRSKGIIVMDREGYQTLKEEILPVEEITFKFKII
jgi:hypothetical protein